MKNLILAAVFSFSLPAFAQSGIDLNAPISSLETLNQKTDVVLRINRDLNFSTSAVLAKGIHCSLVLGSNHFNGRRYEKDDLYALDSAEVLVNDGTSMLQGQVVKPSYYVLKFSNWMHRPSSIEIICANAGFIYGEEAILSLVNPKQIRIQDVLNGFGGAISFDANLARFK